MTISHDQKARRDLGSRAMNLSILAVLVVIYTVPVVNRFLPSRLVLLAILFVVIVAARSTGRLFDARMVALAGICVVVGSAIVESSPRIDPVLQANLQRFIVLFPVAFIAGIAIARSGTRPFLRAAITVAVAMSVLATYEYLTGASLFGREGEFAWLQQGGRSRSLVGAEHSLVLGALLMSSIPALLIVRRMSTRQVLCAIILAGVWFTNSRGSFAFAVPLAALVLFPNLLGAILAKRRPVVVLSVVSFAALAYLSVAVWEPRTTSTNWSENSAQYRPAMYALVPRMLTEIPYGYGFGELPLGRWLVEAPTGFADVAHSTDSQLVLSVLRLGIPGLLAYVAVWVLAIRRWQRSNEIALMLLAVTASGLFVALDAWDGLGTYWVLLAGISFGSLPAILRPEDDTSPHLTGLPLVLNRSDAHRRKSSANPRRIDAGVGNRNLSRIRARAT